MKQKKLNIIKAAERRFNKFGLKKTSLEEIARDLRLGKATLYHYFESKEKLYAETLIQQKKEMLSEVESIFNNENISAADKIEQYLQSKLAIAEKYPLIQSLTNSMLTEEVPDESMKKIYRDLLLDEEGIIALFLNSLANENSIVSDKELAFFLVSGNYLLRSVIISKFDETQPALREEFFKKLSKSLIEYIFSAIGYKTETAGTSL